MPKTKQETIAPPSTSTISTFNQQDLDFASQYFIPPQVPKDFPTLDEQFFQEPRITSITKVSETPQLEPASKEEQELYVPVCSNISMPDEDLIDTSGTVYEAGLCLFASKNGRLQVKKTTLKPGQKCIVNDNYELISEDMEEYNDLIKNSDSSNTNKASFSITIASPGNNVNGCNTQ